MSDPVHDQVSRMAQQQVQTQVDRNAQRRDDQAAKNDNAVFRAVGSGLIGAAIAKTLFGNRGS